VPPIPDEVNITLKNYFMGSYLLVQGVEGRYFFKSPNVSTINIVKECISKQQ